MLGFKLNWFTQSLSLSTIGGTSILFEPDHAETNFGEPVKNTLLYLDERVNESKVGSVPLIVFPRDNEVEKSFHIL